ncbi:MAG: alpha-glucan family phosphorylase [Acidimicrobiales bacterium]
MKADHSFTVPVKLPPALQYLSPLSTNLRWCWDRATQDVFRSMDPAAWEAHHDPVGLLASLDGDRLEDLAKDGGFMALAQAAWDGLNRYLAGSPRLTPGPTQTMGSVAYFSPEFGLTESLAQYSGGLGVLAGDHLKASSDQGLPLIGVGLWYRHGYFRQGLDARGWQQEYYPAQNPHATALRPAGIELIEIKMGELCLLAQVWTLEVGRVRLYLLDSDVEDNPPHLRQVTDTLYGGDIEHRLVQEITLGMGGIKALEALGETPQVFHSNEGHAGFLGLERIRGLVERHRLSFSEAIEAVRAGTVFTTHTPVPAGIDRFPVQLMEKYFSQWASDCGTTMTDLMELGHFPEDDDHEPFNMAVMGLRLAGAANGVSRLHGSVSRELFSPLWPGFDVDEVPIGSITNGVHAPSWVSPEMATFLAATVGDTWAGSPHGGWDGLTAADDDSLWRVRQAGRQRLVDFVRAQVGEPLTEAGPQDGAESLLDPDTLTVCFARRFATYKRATLLLADRDRLRRLLLHPDRPVQFVFAGKAHPADEEGKEMIRLISDFAIESDVISRFVFLPDYDIEVARTLYQGADVWLNTPRRPMEACGTSGEKAALNGSLNLSVLDGWWDEYFNGSNGWAVPTAGYSADLEGRDAAEADAVFRILETKVAPAFYERSDPGGRGLPHRWLEMVRASLRSLGPEVSASRMVKDYADNLYGPAAVRAAAVSIDRFRPARELAGWKAQAGTAWSKVEMGPTTLLRDQAEPMGPIKVSTEIRLAGLDPNDISVEAIHGPVNADGNLDDPRVEPMTPDSPGEDQHLTYRSTLTPSRAGPYGITVRARPFHPDLGRPPSSGLAPCFGPSPSSEEMAGSVDPTPGPEGD